MDKKGNKMIKNKRGLKIRKETKTKVVLRDKKGFELAMNTMVIVILSIIFLVAMIVILNYQTGFFSSFLRNLSGKSNVDAVVIACNSLANQQADYEYCCMKKDIVIGSEKLNLTCSELSGKSYGKKIDRIICENAGC